MDEPDSKHLTLQQVQWFKSLRENLERDTGRSLEAWVEIARTCPVVGHRAKLKWFKETHGLLQNRASYVLSETDSKTESWKEPEQLRQTLWRGEGGRRLLSKVDGVISGLDGVIVGQRKSFSAWSRRAQFAAMRPRGESGAMLGLAVDTGLLPGLIARGHESWSERLKSKIELSTPDDVNADVERLIKAAWAAS